MLSAAPRPSRFMTALFTLTVLAAFGLHAQAQDANGKSQTPYIDDWSHHHMVFSSPGTREDAVKNGKLEEWNRITNDPRYKIQKGRREHGNRQFPDGPGGDPGSGDSYNRHGHDGGGNSASNKNGIEKDWTVNLGVGSTAATKATLKGTFTAVPTTAAESIQIVNPGNTLTMTTNATPSNVTGTFSYPLISTSTITMTVGSNTLSMSSAGTSYATISAEPGNGTTETIAGTTYNWESFCGGAFNPSYCVIRSTTLSTDATNLANAINGSCAGSGTCNVNANIAAIALGGTNPNPSYVFVVNKGATTPALNSITGVSFNNANIAAASTNACSATSGVFTGTFAPSTSTTLATNENQLATNLAAALNLCKAAGLGLATTTSSTNTVPVTASVVGGPTISAFSGGGLNLTAPTTLFAWGVVGGGPGSNACLTPFTAGTYAINTSLTTTAGNLATEITNCNTNNTATGATAANNSSSTVTLTADTAGPSGNAITASSSFAGFTWNATNLSGGSTATVQPNAYPAKWGASLTTESCANDYVVYPVGQPGGTTANIIAYNNLYAGSGPISATGPCVATAGNPTVYFAINTHTGYTVSTSPVLSWDGTQVAFMESNGTSAELVLLKVSLSGSIASPTQLTPVSTTSYRTCTAPCETIVPFTNTNDDTLSAPYYDYGSSGADAIYVGDDQGYLHKFTGVFLGTPAEASTGWPVQLNTTPTLVSSPVFDDTSSRAFVGDMSGVLYSVPSNGSLGTVYNTGSMGDAIADAPLVDSSTHEVFAFLTTRITGGGTCFPNSNVVYGFTTGFTAYGTPGCAYVGGGGTGYYLYAGDFDNVYYQSGGTGNLYVVGNTGATTGANIYQVVISGGFMTGASNQQTAGNVLTTVGVHPWPSGVTEYCNGACTTTTSGCTVGTETTCTAAGSTDYIFFSVYDPVNSKTGCTTGAMGCILSFNVSQPNAIVRSGSGGSYTAPASPGCWGTSGMVIDNDTAASTTGGSQIYFVNLNGAAAGGPNGSTSSACAGGTTPTIAGIQGLQSNP